ncbi:AlpA family transcriptional regulator [Hydrogenophaga sp.]|uniref:helix-turn-helix transcriptional regulator n=1 Tax=Hydrogenophaga sp. TaxID=1904254 RepID=UPI0027290271|nr:AlpA family phage regulatory protein [Hydrogenophaga sp.]MDO9438551.1 AlpA family phage regulatory protein [Hydrogenophaga sp.]
METKLTAAALPQSLHPEQRLKLAAVEALTGTKKSKIYQRVKEGRFPAPERDGTRCSRWRAGDVLDFLQAQRVVKP